MPDLRFSDAEGRSVEDILEIGRRFQNTDSIYRGATYDTAKLLCDTIEILNRTLETERRGYGAKLRSAFEGVMPIVRQYLRRKPICEIMVWDPKDVVKKDPKSKSGTVPDDKVTIVKPVEAYQKAVEALDQACGHWGFVKYDCACCSACGENITTPFDTTAEAEEKWSELYPYCPYCGAKMEYVEPKTGRKRNGQK